MTKKRQVRGLKSFLSNDEVFRIRDKGELRSLTLELTKKCNYGCIYCYAREKYSSNEDKLQYDDFINIINQSIELGVELVNLTGGEPLLYEHFYKLVSYINSKQLDILIFTNGSLVSVDTCKFLLDNNCSICIKLDSFENSKYKFLTGHDKIHDILNIINMLVKSGYNCEDNPILEVNSIATKINLSDILEIWEWCRVRGINPTFTRFWPVGEAAKTLDMMPTSSEMKKLYEDVSLIDKKFEKSWEVNFPGCGGISCRNFYLDCSISCDGYIRPCPCIHINEHNIKNEQLKDVIHNSELFNITRNIEKHIKGYCAICKYNMLCYGCRSIAYGLTSDICASDNLCWHNKHII